MENINNNLVMNDLIETLSKKAKENSPLFKDDYYKEIEIDINNEKRTFKVLCCGKCNTPKEHIFTKGAFAGKKVSCICNCTIQERENTERRLRYKEHEKEMNKCFPDKSMREMTFEKDDKSNAKASKICFNYARGFEKYCKNEMNGLLLFGNVGRGKTFLACCILNELMRANRTYILEESGTKKEINKYYTAMRFTSISRIRDELFNRFDKEDYINEVVANPSVLVIDDLGTEGDSADFMNKLYRIMNARYETGKPTIITTNLSYLEIQEKAKNGNDMARKRVYSRVLEKCLPVLVEGTDRRTNDLKSKTEKFEDELLK